MLIAFLFMGFFAPAKPGLENRVRLLAGRADWSFTETVSRDRKEFLKGAQKIGGTCYRLWQSISATGGLNALHQEFF